MFLIQICGDSNTGNSKTTGHRQIREITTTDKQGWDIYTQVGDKGSGNSWGTHQEQIRLDEAEEAKLNIMQRPRLTK